MSFLEPDPEPTDTDAPAPSDGVVEPEPPAASDEPAAPPADPTDGDGSAGTEDVAVAETEVTDAAPTETGETEAVDAAPAGVDPETGEVVDAAPTGVDPETGEVVVDAEALIEESAPVESPYDRPGRWYVVHTQSGYEKKVKQNLEARTTSMNMEGHIHEVVIPMEEVVEFKGGRKVLGVALLTLAVGVKLPVALALGFVGWCWYGDREVSFLTRVRSAALVVLSSAAALVAMCSMVGIGFGWVTALRDTGKVTTTFSASTKIGLLVADVGHVGRQGGGAFGRLVLELKELREGQRYLPADHARAKSVLRQPAAGFDGNLLLVDLGPQLFVDDRIAERAADEIHVEDHAVRRHPCRRQGGRFLLVTNRRAADRRGQGGHQEHPPATCQIPHATTSQPGRTGIRGAMANPRPPPGLGTCPSGTPRRRTSPAEEPDGKSGWED